MLRFAEACRLVFNRALALQNENCEAGKLSISPIQKWLHGLLSGNPILKHNDLKNLPRSRH